MVTKKLQAAYELTCQHSIEIQDQVAAAMMSVLNNAARPTLWNHESVYRALVAKGLRQKPSDTNKYVCLFDQHLNCAILYAPDAKSYKRAPLHFNEGREEWRPEFGDKLKPFLKYFSTPSKGAGNPDQQFDGYEVLDWNGLAKALGL